MSVNDFFTRIFKKNGNSVKSDSKKPPQPTLIDQIVSYMDLLVQKGGTLNENFSAEKDALQKLLGQVKEFEPVEDIASAKYEQDILGKITAASSECDAVLAGKMGADLKKPLAALQLSVTSRLSIQGRA